LGNKLREKDNEEKVRVNRSVKQAREQFEGIAVSEEFIERDLDEHAPTPSCGELIDEQP